MKTANGIMREADVEIGFMGRPNLLKSLNHRANTCAFEKGWQGRRSKPCSSARSPGLALGSLRDAANNPAKPLIIDSILSRASLR